MINAGRVLDADVSAQWTWMQGNIEFDRPGQRHGIWSGTSWCPRMYMLRPYRTEKVQELSGGLPPFGTL